MEELKLVDIISGSLMAGTLGSLIYTVSLFLKHLEKKDAIDQQRTMEFTSVVKNHLGHSTEVSERLIAQINSLEKVIESKNQ
mgnify:CR=1 FL=1